MKSDQPPTFSLCQLFAWICYRSAPAVNSITPQRMAVIEAPLELGLVKGHLSPVDVALAANKLFYKELNRVQIAEAEIREAIASSGLVVDAVGPDGRISFSRPLTPLHILLPTTDTIKDLSSDQSWNAVAFAREDCVRIWKPSPTGTGRSQFGALRGPKGRGKPSSKVVVQAYLDGLAEPVRTVTSVNVAELVKGCHETVDGSLFKPDTLTRAFRRHVLKPKTGNS